MSCSMEVIEGVRDVRYFHGKLTEFGKHGHEWSVSAIQPRGSVCRLSVCVALLWKRLAVERVISRLASDNPRPFTLMLLTERLE